MIAGCGVRIGVEFRVSELIFLSIDDSRAWSISRSGVEGFCRIGSVN